MKFDNTLLTELIERDSAKLSNTYEYLNRNSTIDFICNCGIYYSKNFRLAYISSGFYCRACTVKNRRTKLEKTCTERYGVINPFQDKQVKELIKQQYLDEYGVDHPSKIEDVKRKKIIMNQLNYGVDNVFQSEEIKNKSKETCLKKYGCEYVSQNESCKKKMRTTLFERYGVYSPLQSDIIKQRAVNTCRKNHGTDYSFQNTTIREKGRKTCLLKYGCENPFQNTIVFQKQLKRAFTIKDYKLPSGKVVKVRGFEPFALDELYKEYLEDEIKVAPCDIPRIEYFNNDKQHYYFPDIFIPSKNKIIEVKSTWTYKLKPDIIKLKGNACKEKGYLYEIWIYDNKKNKTVEVF